MSEASKAALWCLLALLALAGLDVAIERASRRYSSRERRIHQLPIRRRHE